MSLTTNNDVTSGTSEHGEEATSPPVSSEHEGTTKTAGSIAVPPDKPVGDGATGAAAAPAPPPRGLSWPMAAAFVAGETAGGGMLVLPYSLTLTGPVGAPLVLLLGLAVAYCGLCLARSWLALERRRPRRAADARAPYLELAELALGRPGRAVTSVGLAAGSVGICVVYLILVGGMLDDLLPAVLPECGWSAAVTLALVPLCWLGSPADLGWVALGALATSLLGWLLMCLQLVVSFPRLRAAATFRPPTLASFFLGLGPILFSYSGAFVFPSVQKDMAERALFGRAVRVGFAALLAMYVLLATLGYAALGDDQRQNLLATLAERVGGPLPKVAEALFVGHLLTAYVLYLNPFFQQVEGALGLPDHFGLVRIVFRTVVIGLVLLTALIIPDVVDIMDLVPALPLVNFIIPPILYVRICARTEAEWAAVPIWNRLILFSISAVSTIVAVASMCSAATHIISKGFHSSCLVLVHGADNTSRPLGQMAPL